MPEEVRNYIYNKCQRWDKSPYGYNNKLYSSNVQKQLQLDLNSNIDESTICNLINNNTQFVFDINKYLQQYINIFNTKLYIDGKYEFNTAHGLTDHDQLLFVDYTLNDGDWTDLHRSNINKFDSKAIWSIEIKSTTSYSKWNYNQSSYFHKADLVLIHIMDTGEIKILIPNSYLYTKYIEVGTLNKYFFNNKRISNNWEIMDF